MSDEASNTPITTISEEATPSTPVPEDAPIIVQEINSEPKVGDIIGQCKWWSDKLGYGFITVQNGEMKGKDIFVHHSGIRPLNSNYKTLKKGEYVNFDVTEGEHGLQAVNVTGIGGGSLICDVNPHVKHMASPQVAGAPPPPPPRQQQPYVSYEQRTIANLAAASQHGGPGRGGGRAGGRGGGYYSPRPYNAGGRGSYVHSPDE